MIDIKNEIKVIGKQEFMGREIQVYNIDGKKYFMIIDIARLFNNKAKSNSVIFYLSKDNIYKFNNKNHKNALFTDEQGVNIIIDRKMYNRNIKENRKGLKNKNKLGLEYIIVDYISAKDVVIKFTNTGTIKHITYDNFKNGYVYDEMEKSICNIGYLGIGKYNSKNCKRAYDTWNNMIHRCYDNEKSDRNKSY